MKDVKKQPLKCETALDCARRFILYRKAIQAVVLTMDKEDENFFIKEREKFYGN